MKGIELSDQIMPLKCLLRLLRLLYQLKDIVYKVFDQGIRHVGDVMRVINEQE